MPIKIPTSLPARATLESENIFVMTESRALHQDISPLKLLILNLMPTKIVTETQLLRKLSNTPLQIEVQLLRTISHDAKNTSDTHLENFYVSLADIQGNYYDGMIITGAPVENLDFQDVDYWEELCRIMDWTKEHVHCTLHICWGAQAALYHHHGVPKHSLEKKLSGVFPHVMLRPNAPIFRGFDPCFYVPHSRYTTVLAEDIAKVPQLEIMSVSPDAGVFMVKTEDSRQFFITGHPEYDLETLQLEYQRDVSRGIAAHVPEHYFPDDDPSKPPMMTWRAHAQLLYTNWLNYYVYQTTPYDINRESIAGSSQNDA